MDPKLIKTLDEVKQNVPVNMTSDFDVVKPFLCNAEVQYVARLIGKAQFDALAAKYEDDGGTDIEKEAIDHCQKIISNLGYYFAIPILSVSVGTSGIQILSNSDTKQAFQWQVNDLKNALQELGFTGIEQLLTFLEENIESFTLYAGSDQRLAQLECLITTAYDFNDHFEINASRLVFQTITYIMKRVETQTVGRILGPDFLDSLKATDLSEKKKKLVKNYLKPGIALLTIAKAAIERVINLQNGQVTYNFRGRTDNMLESQALNNQQIKDATDQLIADGNMCLQDGLAYIIANPADFTDFTPPVPRRRFQVKNDPCKGLFVT